MATTQLDLQFDEIQKLVLAELEEKKTVALSADGSSDQCKDPVVNVVALTPKPLLLQTIRNEEKSQTAERIFENVKQVKETFEKGGMNSEYY